MVVIMNVLIDSLKLMFNSRMLSSKKGQDKYMLLIGIIIAIIILVVFIVWIANQDLCKISGGWAC
jgi:uncharacterized integral membrane protein